MEIANLSAAQLRELIKHVERRDALVAELEKLEGLLQRGFAGKPAAPKTTRKRRKGARKKTKAPVKAAKAPAKAPAKAAKAPAKAAKAPAKAAKAPAKAPDKGPAKAAKPAKRGKRGALKAKILRQLKAAGPEGALVRDIAAKLKANPQNIHVWFSSTGRNVPGLVRIAEGRYRLG
jgi:hypothetical protein